MILSGRRERSNRASVEAVFQSDNGGIFRTFFVRRIFAGGFYGAFVCFGTGIGKKQFFHSAFFA